mgnify:CR=1 FL=1
MIQEKPVVGLALGGGSARALAHIGALKALEAKNLAPQVLAGTSYGAFIAALYALVGSATALEETLRNQNTLEFWEQALDFGLHKASLMQGQRAVRWLEHRYFHGATFADLSLPVAIACTDTGTGELRILREGSVAKAIMASCALPGLIGAVNWQGRWLVDGGLVATVPFAALADMNTTLNIGIHTGVQENSRFVHSLRRWHASALGRAWQRQLLKVQGRSVWASFIRGLARVQASYEQRITAPEDALLISIDPPLAWWDFHKISDAIAVGEQVTLGALERWQAQTPSAASRE